MIRRHWKDSRVIRLTSTVLHLTKALLESLNLHLELSHALVKHFEYFAIVFMDGTGLGAGDGLADWTWLGDGLRSKDQDLGLVSPHGVFVSGSSLVDGSVARGVRRMRTGGSVDVVLNACGRLVRSGCVNGSMIRSSGVDRSMNKSIARGAGCNRISGSHLVYCTASVLLPRKSVGIEVQNPCEGGIWCVPHWSTYLFDALYVFAEG
jgi:hypothetical protein